MRFLTIYRPAGNQPEGAPCGPPSEAMRHYAEVQTRAGVLVAQAMLDSAITEVCFDGSGFTVNQKIDPAAGYAIIEATTREEAVKSIKEFLEVAGNGTSEMRQVFE